MIVYFESTNGDGHYYEAHHLCVIRNDAKQITSIEVHSNEAEISVISNGQKLIIFGINSGQTVLYTHREIKT